ncbi:hypothetical protein B0H11DRAFT_2224540 [Mycena galericulata]|nr:hypothetical protein B0H11DRAFT_2224540 [Mycena galericulata]
MAFELALVVDADYWEEIQQNVVNQERTIAPPGDAAPVCKRGFHRRLNPKASSLFLSPASADEAQISG